MTQSRTVRLFILLLSIAVSAVCYGCRSTDDSGGSAGENAHTVETYFVEVIKNGGSDVFFVPFDQYQGELRDLPIGVFDSGIGGLTVLAALLDADSFDNITHAPGPDGVPDFDNERFIYLGDQANMPYGNYPSVGKTDFLRELIIKDAVFLLGNRYWPTATAQKPRNDKPSVKAIVIACNTATAYGLEDIRDALNAWGLPVYLVGVVEAGAKGAVAALKERGGEGAVAVMATVGTCASEGYPRALEKVAVAEGVAVPDVTQQGSLGLAGAIEGDESFVAEPSRLASVDYKGPSLSNTAAPIDAALAVHYGFERDGLIGDPADPATWRLNSIENYIRYDTVSLLDAHRKKSGAPPITTIILGCTHFPFHEERIETSFARLREFRAPDGSMPYEGTVGGHIDFIDPSVITAEQLYEALAASDRLVPGGDGAVIAFDEFYISVPNTALAGVPLTDTGGFTYEFKYGREPGDYAVEYVRRVPMCGENLSGHVQASIRETMPEVWRRLVLFNELSPRVRDLPVESQLK